MVGVVTQLNIKLEPESLLQLHAVNFLFLQFFRLTFYDQLSASGTSSGLCFDGYIM